MMDKSRKKKNNGEELSSISQKIIEIKHSNKKNSLANFIPTQRQ